MTTTTESQIMTGAFTIVDEHMIFECTARGHRFASAMLVDTLTITRIQTTRDGMRLDVRIPSADRRRLLKQRLRDKFDDLIRAALERVEIKTGVGTDPGV